MFMFNFAICVQLPPASPGTPDQAGPWMDLLAALAAMSIGLILRQRRPARRTVIITVLRLKVRAEIFRAGLSFDGAPRPPHAIAFRLAVAGPVP